MKKLFLNRLKEIIRFRTIIMSMNQLWMKSKQIVPIKVKSSLKLKIHVMDSIDLFLTREVFKL